ncbi:hypothetical protein [Halocatena marina]|uniref:hypothetical protein n=1 Tax=Halocatena marina TaxID=2934937 RepID=UPI00200E7B44|nr:hypothetical protein [Halocatena marina]
MLSLLQTTGTAVPLSAWVVMLGAIVLLWGVAGWALYRTLTDEERKLDLIRDHGTIDTYSPRTMAELREWIEAHPDHPENETAKAAYNDCVETLHEIDTPFYEWSDEQRAELEQL